MKEFGEYLRNERLSRGVTLEEIERKTRIRRYHLIAMENGDFHKLPEPAYVRMFLRHYAECIGLDKNAVVERYDALQRAAIGQVSAAARSDDPGRSERRKRQLKARRRRRAVQWLIVTALLLFVAYLQWPNLAERLRPGGDGRDVAPAGSAGPLQQDASVVVAPPAGAGGAPAEDQADAPAADLTQGEPAQGDVGGEALQRPLASAADRDAAGTGTEAANEEPAAPAAEEAAPTSVPANAFGGAAPAEAGPPVAVDAAALRDRIVAAGGGPVAVPPLAPGDRFTFGLRALDVSWVELWVDGARRIYRNLEAGEAYTYEVRDEVSLRFGRAENVIVALNGVEVGTLGSAVTSQRFILDRSDTLAAE